MPNVPHSAFPPSMHPKAVGARLRLLREAANLSAAEVCRTLGINRGSYSMFEQGKRATPEDVKVQLADFYGTMLDYLTLGRATESELNVVVDLSLGARQKLQEKIGECRGIAVAPPQHNDGL